MLEQGTFEPSSAATRLVRAISICKPLLKTLHCVIGRLNGPFAVPTIPSGKKGRARNPTARSLKATEPFNSRPSAAAAST